MALRKKRPLVVIDTNVIISAATMQKSSAAREIIRLWKQGYLQLVLSNEIIHEYLRVLGEFGLNRLQMRKWAEWFAHPSKTVQLVSPREVDASRDPNDNMFLGAAVTAHADFIITRDNDLLVLGEFEGIPIIEPAESLNRRRAEQQQRKTQKKQNKR